MNKEELTELVREWVRENSLDPDLTATSLSADTDLVTTGMIDSIGFMELLAFLEAELGIEVDVSAARPEEFTSIQGLCSIALSN